MTRTRFTSKFITLSLFFLLSTNLYVNAAEKCTPWVAKAISIQGNVEKRSITNESSSPWLPIKRDDELCAGDIIRVKQNSRAALILKNDTILRLNQNTTITLSGFNDDQSHWLNLNEGMAHFIARIKQSFKVITPFVNAAVEGTEFVINVTASQSEVTVFEGTIKASNNLGETILIQGQTSVATEKSAPTIIVKVNPRNAVQWSLYYPAIINYKNIQLKNKEQNNETNFILEQSITAAQKGDIYTAISLIDTIKSSSNNIELQVYKATLYLSVGKITSSQKEIQLVLNNQENNPQAIALRSLIATVKNNKTKALELAIQATQIAPKAYEPAIALSYAYQNMFDIKSALSSIESLIEKNKNNALLWSRLSELNLMTGNLDKALNSAKQALKLNPNVSRTQTTLGFAYLTQIQPLKAQLAFNKAIEIDGADPLSHLGLGLVIIRQGNLSLGRQHIEFAATLDPNNALIRSYLGKAYYEEKREKLAIVQFTMAKQLDPNNPTAYYYNAILLQSINRPIEALHELQQSIALNNNRAVYRSSLLLDQDEAARSASMARIYNELKFGQLALQEGWTSINADPTNSSAHRLLADSYFNLPRHEKARVSELLQAQLLQPLNLNPIQPQLTISHLGILDSLGPLDSSYSEFNSMFTKNNFDIQVSTIVGNNDTRGIDLVVSGLHNKFSYSLGKFNYKTNGFRPNNDLEHNLYNAFIQYKISHHLNLQAEFRNKKSSNGDLLLAFDPNTYEPNKRTDIKTKSNRIGFNYSINAKHTLLGSIINYDRFEEKQLKTIRNEAPFTIKSNKLVTEDEQANSVELQYLYNSTKLKVITGISDIDLKHEQISSLNQVALPPGPIIPITSPPTTLSNLDTKHTTTYIYSKFSPVDNSTFTLGLSYDNYKIQGYKNQQINPKLGFQYNIKDKSLFRMAAFSTVLRPTTTTNQTIEPTNIAGFNQFYDDLRGAKITKYGFAVDHSFSKTLKISIEPSWRSLNIPNINNNTSTSFDEFDEQAIRAYLYFIINSKFTLSTEYFYENFKSATNNINNTTPQNLVTSRIPITLNYSNPFGINIQLISSYIDQKYTKQNKKRQTDNFWVTDFLISYRFRKRVGIISLGIKNVFNRKFNFYDLEYNGLSRTPFIQPEQSIFTKLSFSF